MSLYYQDDHVTLYHGNAVGDHREWLDASTLVTDPPYGRAWRQGAMVNTDGHGTLNNSHGGIANDDDTEVRDTALSMWGDRRAIVFGDLMLAPPQGTKQVLIYAKAVDSGIRGATAGHRRDAEAIYLLGAWPSGIGGRSSIYGTGGRSAGPRALAVRYGHPHAKPLDVLEPLIAACPPGVIADPFAGSGSTLVAAKMQGRKAVGVELDEAYCEIIAKRLDQGVLDIGALA